jgi:TonB family protein
MNHLFLKSFSAIVAAVAMMSAWQQAHAEDTIEVIGHQTAEGQYVSQVRTMLTKEMRLPSGREASLTHPEGTVAVWFVLARDGTVVGRGVEQSSNSALLDAQARALVGRATYAALPAQAWAGENEHRFVATYRFMQPSSQPKVGTEPVMALR